MHKTSVAPSMSGRARTGSVLRVIAVVMLAGGVAMAAMPFVGPLIGVPFDAFGPWVFNQNRLVLHVLPGLLAVGVGAVLLLAHRHVRETGRTPGWLPAAIGAGLLVGLWNGAGPWALDAMLPASDNGLMFVGISGWQTFTTTNQLVLEAVCHWIPGMLPIIGAAVAYRLVQEIGSARPATTQ